MKDKIAPHTRYAQKYHQASSSDASTTAKVDADADESWCAEEVVVSCSAIPTDGTLKVEYVNSAGVAQTPPVLHAHLTTAGAIRFNLHGVNRSPTQNETLRAVAEQTGTSLKEISVTLFYR